MKNLGKVLKQRKLIGLVFQAQWQLEFDALPDMSFHYLAGGKELIECMK